MDDRRWMVAVAVILVVCVGLYVTAFILITSGEFFAGSLVAMILWVAVSVMTSVLPNWVREDDE